MQARQSLPVVLVVLSILAPVAASSAETPRAYLIEMNLTATAPNGSEQILSCPRVMVLDGYEACGDFGGTLAPPAGVKVQEPLQSGSHYRVKVLPNHGQLFVDATLNKSSGQTDADGVSIATLGARVVRAVKLGKKITVPLDGSRLRWELLVDEAPGDATWRRGRLAGVAPIVSLPRRRGYCRRLGGAIGRGGPGPNGATRRWSVE